MARDNSWGRYLEIVRSKAFQKDLARLREQHGIDPESSTRYQDRRESSSKIRSTWTFRIRNPLKAAIKCIKNQRSVSIRLPAKPFLDFEDELALSIKDFNRLEDDLKELCINHGLIVEKNLRNVGFELLNVPKALFGRSNYVIHHQPWHGIIYVEPGSTRAEVLAAFKTIRCMFESDKTLFELGDWKERRRPSKIYDPVELERLIDTKLRLESSRVAAGETTWKKVEREIFDEATGRSIISKNASPAMVREQIRSRRRELRMQFRIYEPDIGSRT